MSNTLRQSVVQKSCLQRILALSALVIFSALVALFVVNLDRDPRFIPSPLVGTAAPDFRLPQLHDPVHMASLQDMQGKVWLLNVWASWCVACRIEHEHLLTLMREDQATIIGLNYRDQPTDARQWLSDYGDPYHFSVVDADGLVGIEWGVYGVPETFLIDQNGIIRYKHIGPLQQQDVDTIIRPWLAQLAS